MPKYPFEAPFDEILRASETYVEAGSECVKYCETPLVRI